jgi:parvulin-like peptidyl-prolyl isomerase
MKILSDWLLLIFLSVIIFVSCGRQEEIVAEVGSLVISKDEFIKELKTIYPHLVNIKDIDFEKREKVLNRMILKKQKVNAGYDLNLDKDINLVREVKNHKDRLVANKYYEKMVIDKIVPKQEIDVFVERQGTELKASHILIGHKQSSAKISRTRDEARLLAEKVADEAKNGADFTELVEKYSNDPSAKKNKGDLSYFKWGRMVPAFQEAAWNLRINEISEPVETRYGFHIIRLDDRRENADYQPSTDVESLYRIKEQLYQSKADSGKKLWSTHFQQLKEKYSYRLEQDNITALASLLTEKMKNENLEYDSFGEEELETKLVSWDGGGVSFQDVLEKYRKDLSRILGRFRQPKALQKEVEGLSTIQVVVTDAKKYDIFTDKDIIEKSNIFFETQLARLAENNEIREKVVVNEEDALKYYQENPDKFKKAAEIEMWEIFVKDEKKAKQILKLAQEGQDFAELAKKYSLDKTYASRGGYLGFRQIKARGPVSQKAFELGPSGKIGGPIKYRNGWTIFKTGEKREESIKVFENVKRLAESRVRNERIKQRRVQWENHIKEEYPAVIYNKRVEEI